MSEEQATYLKPAQSREIDMLKLWTAASKAMAYKSTEVVQEIQILAPDCQRVGQLMQDTFFEVLQLADKLKDALERIMSGDSQESAVQAKSRSIQDTELLSNAVRLYYKK